MLILALFLSYLIGAIPFGVLAGRMRGIDIRAVGSGNSGATNVWRTLGPAAGATVFTLDVLKGLVAPFIGKALVGPQEYTVIALCALMAVVGHTFSCFLKFRGGKGVATGLGMALGLMPVPALLAFALWGLVLLVTRMISVASVIAIVVAPFIAIAFNAPMPYVAVAVLLAVVTFVKHIPNLKRIATGTEPKVGSKKTKAEQEQVLATPEANIR